MNMLQTFLALFANATAVTVDDSPVLMSWTQSELDGDADNKVLRFHWNDDKFGYSATLTEGGIAAGQFDEEGRFVCEDHEGQRTVITCYALQQLKPAQ